MTTITTSRVGTVIDALVAACKLNATFVDPVRVYDGPVDTLDVMFNQAVFIGFDGNWQGTFESAVDNARMRYLGNTSMQETIDLRCCSIAWSGDPTWQILRNQALAVLAGVETVIRTDPTLGIDGSTIAQVPAVDSVYQLPPTTWGPEPYTSAGAAVRIPFIVHVETILLSV